MKASLATIVLALLTASFTTAANAVFLNDANITVSLGSSMSAEPFANRSTAASLASVIDAPSAAASENHSR